MKQKTCLVMGECGVKEYEEEREEVLTMKLYAHVVVLLYGFQGLLPRILQFSTYDRRRFAGKLVTKILD